MNNKENRVLKQASKPVRARKRRAVSAQKRQPVRSRSNDKKRINGRSKKKLQSLQHAPSNPKQSILTSREEREYENKAKAEKLTDLELIEQYKPTLSNARLDRINVKIKLRNIECDLDESELIKEYTSGQPRHARKELLPTYSKTLNVKKKFYTAIRQQEIEIEGRKYSSPLLNGKLTFPRQKLSKQGGNSVYEMSIHYDVNLNPTRAINHLPMLHDLKREELRARLLGNSIAEPSEKELMISLDNNDNLIPFDTGDKEYGIAEKSYISSTIKGLTEEIERVFQLLELQLSESAKLHSITFKEVETYWDLKIDDAPALLERIKPYVMSYGRSVREREHGHDEHIIENQKSLTIFISKQERLRIYAKTPTRIRFEVVSILKNGSRWLKGGRSRKTTIGSQSLIRQVKSKSKERIEDLRAYLLDVMKCSPPQITAKSPDFIYAWASLLHREPFAKKLYSLLAANGKLVGGNGLKAQDKSVDRIIRRATEHKLLVMKGGALHPNLPCA